MMQQPDQKLKERVTQALEQHSKTVPKQQLAQRIHAELQQRHAKRYERWGVRVAMVAVVTGLFTIPFFVQNTPRQDQAIDTKRISPQFAEDLEMLKVLGQEAHAQ